MKRLLSRLDLDGSPLDHVCGVILVVATAGLLTVIWHAAWVRMMVP